MKFSLLLFVISGLACAQQANVTNVTQVKRIYVDALLGGGVSSGFRDLIIAHLNDTHLFLLTDNPDRADAILKGAADDREFTDTVDSVKAISVHQGTGRFASGKSAAGISGGSVNGGASDTESHHIREHKQQAYAALRLCNREGDVIWSTTQESNGAKFRSASIDVAAKVAHQLAFDFQRQSAAPAK